jgi:uncharacterized protein (DUF1501 family)
MNSIDCLSRRRFLRAAAAGGIAYAFARTPGIAYAQMAGDDGFPDYKALVCVFLLGGNDSWNMVVPSSDAEHAAYAGARQNLAVPKESLLPLNPAVMDPSGWTFGLHPAMPGIAEMFDTGRAAFVANVGPLLAPTTLTQYLDRSIALPPQLFSHQDQQRQWHSLTGNAPSKSGWAGRIADLFGPRVSGQQLALNVSLSGQTLFQSGATSVPYTMGAAGPTRFKGFSGSGAGSSRREAFAALAEGSHESLYEQAFAEVHLRALRFGDSVGAALAATPDFASLPNDPATALSGLAVQLRTVAKLIAARDRLQMSRQIFFVATGGFDTHDDQVSDQPTLLGTLSDGLARFDDAVQQLGVADRVVTFTQSDFGRTLTSNGDGTDHAWGGIQVVTGGAVTGGRVFGEYPLLRLGARRGADRADDVGGGRFIPTLSSDQYVATLAGWFGVAEADMRTIAPNIDNFAVRDLGFLA